MSEDFQFWPFHLFCFLMMVHANCILDLAANILICHIVFVGNVPKSPIAYRLKGLDPSFEFYCKGPALTGMKERRQAIEMFVFLHMSHITRKCIFGDFRPGEIQSCSATEAS